jgi:uncharacterized protein (TIGR01777 family)
VNVVIAGGTGFLGTALADRLSADGHDVVVLTRRDPAKSRPGRHRLVRWTPTGEAGPWQAEISNAGAVVNLAGEPIAGKRWSAAQKQRITDSRIDATKSVVDAIRSAPAPTVLINASAVGYYGPLTDEVVTEERPAGNDFLATLCTRWEAEASRAAARVRVVCVRTGLVLEKDGGALARMLPPFKMGLGGPVGSGRQYWPWIHRQDWVDLVRWSILTPSASGALNATAPNPVTNAEFTRALGKALGRPAFMPAPAFALRLVLGEMAGALLMSGQRAVPAKAQRLGFAFRYVQVTDALNAIVRARNTV